MLGHTLHPARWTGKYSMYNFCFVKSIERPVPGSQARVSTEHCNPFLLSDTGTSAPAQGEGQHSHPPPRGQQSPCTGRCTGVRR